MIWIKLEELIDPTLFPKIPAEHKLNLQMLWYKASLLRAACRVPFTIRTLGALSRGYRTAEMQEMVYAEINKKRVFRGELPIKAPMESMHLVGAACDVFDPEQRLQMWIRAHEDWCKKMGMWFESFKSTPDWVHIQIYPPASGIENLYFIP